VWLSQRGFGRRGWRTRVRWSASPETAAGPAETPASCRSVAEVSFANGGFVARTRFGVFGQAMSRYGPRTLRRGFLEDRGVGFRSLKEFLDTTIAGGRLIFPVFGALAEFERDIIRERTITGLEAARVRGRHDGRPRALEDDKAQLARRLKAEGDHSVSEICPMLGVGRSTLYRYLKERGNGPRAAG
jgi:hypothetical protein